MFLVVKIFSVFIILCSLCIIHLFAQCHIDSNIRITFMSFIINFRSMKEPIPTPTLPVYSSNQVQYQQRTLPGYTSSPYQSQVCLLLFQLQQLIHVLMLFAPSSRIYSGLFNFLIYHIVGEPKSDNKSYINRLKTSFSSVKPENSIVFFLPSPNNKCILTNKCLHQACRLLFPMVSRQVE